jgi:hypothetical protein
MRWERGRSVGIRLSPDGCLVLGGEGSAANGAGDEPRDGTGDLSTASDSLGGQDEPLTEEEHAHQ